LRATGRVLDLRFVGVFEFAAGVVVRERVYYDRFELLRRLGAPSDEVGR
jgi:hypothetical protein